MIDAGVGAVVGPERERKTKNKQNRAMGQAGDTHGTLGAESRMCPRYSHHYECGTHSGLIVSLAL